MVLPTITTEQALEMGTLIVAFDEQAAYAEIDRVARALVKRLGFSTPTRWPVIA